MRVNVPAGLETNDAAAIQAMALSLFVHRRSTAEHTSRVAGYVRILAEGLGFGEDDVAVFEAAAVLHDLGKIAVPDEVLNKPSSLTPAERRVIRRHSAIGAEMVGAVDAFAQIATMVRHHHERMDGTGYPDGLHGDAIPLGSRLIAIADTFDAITSDRPYRLARSADAALAELEAAADSQLDGAFVARFIALARHGFIRVTDSRDAATYANAARIFAAFGIPRS